MRTSKDQLHVWVANAQSAFAHCQIDSPSPSPPRKRQRLSSPTYDDQMDDLSQDELKGIHDLEVKLSQTSQPRGPDVHHRVPAVGESSQESDPRRVSAHILTDQALQSHGAHRDLVR